MEKTGYKSTHFISLRMKFNNINKTIHYNVLTVCLPVFLSETGGLMKAVTSAKLSGTCRYALIGYGVRVGGQVPDHSRRYVYVIYGSFMW